MRGFNQKGVIHLLVPIILILGLVVGVYLVTSGNPLKLFSKASMSKPTGPETSFALIGPNQCASGLVCTMQFLFPPQPQKQFDVKFYARSDIEEANLFEAKMAFPKDLVEVVEIKLADKFNEVENYYDNNSGEISLVGGVHAPGLQTKTTEPSILMATITFKAKALGKGTVSFTDDSAIYSNLNNINILTIKRNYDVSVEVAPVFTPEAGFEIGIEAGEQHDTSRVGLVKESGAKWVRLNFVGSDWSVNSADTNTYNTIINAYRAQNIKIIGLIGIQSVSEGYDRNKPENFTARFTDTADAIIARFGDRVKVYELFNEPNDWVGGSSSQLPESFFATYLASIYKKIKIDEAKSDIMLNSGPLFSFDLNNGASYLQGVYDAGKGLGGDLNWNTIKTRSGSYPLDGIGYHIYVAQGTADQDQVENKMKANMDAIDTVINNNDVGKKIWITEFGWGTGGRVTPEVQALNLEKAFNILKNRSSVKMAMWFALMDFDGSEWGLISADGTKKPAWNSFQKVNGATPVPTCMPRPTCLDAKSHSCKISEPSEGWCPAPLPIPGTTKGDGNKDGKINLTDMSVIHTDWMKTSNMVNFRTGIDMNDDKLINTFDFGLHRKLLQQLGIIRVK